MDGPGLEYRQGQEIFLPLKPPQPLWNLPSLISISGFLPKDVKWARSDVEHPSPSSTVVVSGVNASTVWTDTTLTILLQFMVLASSCSIIYCQCVGTI
jgi:hypothetical protein